MSSKNWLKHTKKTGKQRGKHRRAHTKILPLSLPHPLPEHQIPPPPTGRRRLRTSGQRAGRLLAPGAFFKQNVKRVPVPSRTACSGINGGKKWHPQTKSEDTHTHTHCGVKTRVFSLPQHIKQKAFGSETKHPPGSWASSISLHPLGAGREARRLTFPTSAQGLISSWAWLKIKQLGL